MFFESFAEEKIEFKNSIMPMLFSRSLVVVFKNIKIILSCLCILTNELDHV